MTTRAGRAVVITGAGGPEVLSVQPRNFPPPGPGQLRIEVRAAGLNRADLLQRRGRYPAPKGAPADVPGLEYAGVVDAVGEGATLFSPGDRVIGLVAGGAMASFVTVHEREAIRAPAGLSDVELAAIPEAFATAWDALVVQAGLRPGEAVLVHAVGSGVGTAAVQLCRVAGARVIGTSRSADKLARLELDAAIVPAEGRFAAAVRVATGGRGADVILDLVGGPYVAEGLEAAAERARILCVGTLGGGRAELPLGLLLSRRVQLCGTVLRARPLEEKFALARAFEAQLVPLFEAKRLRPVVEATLPLEAVAAAHARLEADGTFGKLVLTL